MKDGAGYLNRPEITRSNDYLAKDQRKMLDTQRKRLQFLEKIQRNQLNGLISSKIFQNIQKSADQCWNICQINKNEPPLITPYNKMLNEKKSYLDPNCLKNCIGKKNESYQMLIQYFFAKMQLAEDKKEDFQELYEIPDKFRDSQFK